MSYHLAVFGGARQAVTEPPLPESVGEFPGG
jgi:hypothetical protein